MDLFKYSFTNITLIHNAFTYFNFNKPAADWQAYIHVDGMAALLRTEISDTSQINDINVNSILLGSNCTARFRNDKNFMNRVIFIDISGQLFWVNALSNDVSSDLNAQYTNGHNPPLHGKPFTVDPYPYTRFEFLSRINFETTESQDNNKTKANTHTPKSDYSGSALFVRVSFTSNFVPSISKTYLYNNYFSAQIGVSIDINGALQKSKS